MQVMISLKCSLQEWLSLRKVNISMPSLRKAKNMNYSPQFLFDLVLDIESYPQFLPWCAKASIISKNEHEINAELIINFQGFSSGYLSRVTFDNFENTYKIDVQAISGPFKYLINKWHFQEIDKNLCKVEFFIDFEFKTMLLNKLIGVFFAQATEKMILAFEERAKNILSKNVIH